MTVWDIYLQSKKRVDINLFTEWVARPMAAVVVWSLRPTKVTPNHLTIASLFLCLVAAGIVALAPLTFGYRGAFAGIFLLSFVLDCADGQLARIKGIASPLGHLFDYLMDEWKAGLIWVGVSVHVWRTTQDQRWLLVASIGAVAIFMAVSLTSLMRRPEYTGKSATWSQDGDPVVLTQRSGLGHAIGALERIGRLAVHYPQYVWLLALLGRLDLYLWIYGVAIGLYLAKSLLSVLLRLARI